MKIAVLIRVYDRVEDLKHNLEIIRNTWTQNDYFIVVVSNGASKGYVIDCDSIPLIDKLIVLEENAGHKKGNSQLLIEGAKYIPSYCPYTLILEADTWVYTDVILTRYTKLLDALPTTVWASADWYDKYYALATDFAIVKSQYVKENPNIFNFELFPECHIANFLRDTSAKWIWIKENMPVHVPSYLSTYPYIHNKERRFYIFPKSKTATHHIEFLKGGMEEKKAYFNILANCDYFPEVKVKNKPWKRFKAQFWIALSQCFLKRSWYSQKMHKHI